MVNVVFGDNICIDAEARWVALSMVAATFRSTALCCRVVIVPFLVSTPVPLRVNPVEHLVN
jgi:hypothetical protein